MVDDSQPDALAENRASSGPVRDDDAILRVEGLTKVYDDGTLAVDDIDFTVDHGDFCVIIGPSGCGKSTTLHSIVGKVAPTSGSIVLDGVNMTDFPTYRRDISLVFQDFQLFPHLTIEENVYYGLEAADIEKSEEEIDSTLELLDLNESRDSLPSELSAGQKQRVAVARSLVLEPKLLLLDEPLGDLDYKLQKQMERELLRIHRKTDTTFVYVTHNQNQAMRLADQIIVLNGGKIEQSGTVDEVYNSPATAFVSTFVGDSNIFSGEIIAVSDDGDQSTIDTPYGTFQISTRNLRSKPQELVGDVIPFSIRPHNLRLSEDQANTLTCTVNDVIHRPDSGTQLILHAESEKGARKEIQFTSWERLDISTDTIAVGWSAEDAVMLEELSVLDSIDLDTDILGE